MVMATSPPLNGLRAFEAAARHLSFKKAAEELCVTHGAVSRHIRKLEEHVGTKLFIRRNRRVELTLVGVKYMQEIGDAFGRIYRATAELVADANRKMLRLKVPPTFAIRWLVPRLAGYQARYPDMSVQILTPYVHPTFEHDVDIAVCYQTPEVPPGIACEKLFDEILLPVMSPGNDGHGHRLSEPNDLAHHVLLHSMIRIDDWRRWLDAASADAVDPHNGLRFENSGLVYQALAEGLGIAIGQFALVADDIAAGRLLAPFSTAVYGESGYYLVYPEASVRNRYATDFREWIIDEASKTNRASLGWLAAPSKTPSPSVD
jgi:LysR family glycine cleavage system transcriptional activator